MKLTTLATCGLLLAGIPAANSQQIENQQPSAARELLKYAQETYRGSIVPDDLHLRLNEALDFCDNEEKPPGVRAYGCHASALLFTIESRNSDMLAARMGRWIDSLETSSVCEPVNLMEGREILSKMQDILLQLVYVQDYGEEALYLYLGGAEVLNEGDLEQTIDLAFLGEKELERSFWGCVRSASQMLRTCYDIPSW